MKKHTVARLALIASLTCFVAGCSSDDTKDRDAGGSGDDATAQTDKGLIADLFMGEGGTASCGPDIYPCGASGTRKGDLVENYSFIGFSDPDSFCKPAKDRAIDFNTKIQRSFADWYLPPANCPDKKKKLLWVTVSAGWCPPCIDEIRSTMSEIKNGTFPPEVDVVDILFENGDQSPVTEEWAKTEWYRRVGLNYTLLLDPSFKMGKYFDRESVPFNMLIDLSTMKIVFAATGNVLQEVGAAIQQFLKGS